jgi:cyclic beta-1,2-glucan synthetase
VTWRLGRTRYDISLANPELRCRGIASAQLDGVPVDPRAVPLLEDGAVHELRLVLGRRSVGATPHPSDTSTVAR